MKLTSSGISLISCLLVCVSFISCAGIPSGTVKSALPVTEPGSQPVLQPIDEQVAQPAIEPVVAVKTETPTPQEVNIPETVFPDISVPPGEKLLYFYPEPDFQFIVPISPAVSKAPAPSVIPPAKTMPAAGTKVVTAPVPTPKDSVKTDTTDKNTPAVPTATVEKPVDNVLPGIWESEPVAPTQNTVNTAPAISPSRKVTVAKGQTLEVWYPGSGWVYLGDVSAQNGLSYETRKLADKDTLFTFKALKPGNYLLEFSRFDVLEDSFLSDALAVTVTDTPDTRIEKVRAPDYRSTTPSTTGSAIAGTPSTAGAVAPAAVSSALTAPISTTAIKGSSSPSSVVSEEPSLLAGKTAVPSNVGTSKPSSADAKVLLDKAKASLASGDAVSALRALESFFSVAVDSLDEGLFLKGQAYEANGASRDIRKALDAYQTLTSAYPESVRWNEADARIRYINQFYMKIR